MAAGRKAIAQSQAAPPAKKAAGAKKAARSIPTRLVRVHFFRAVRMERSGEEWTWPADDDVGQALVDGFNAAEESKEDWPLTSWWGRDLLIETHETTAPIQMGVGNVRADRLPLVLRAGARSGSPLPLAERDRLLEPTYLTFFGSRVVAIIGATEAPGASMAAWGLARLTGVDVDFVPIPRPDVLQAVQQGNGVSTFDIKVAAGSVDVATETDDLVRAAETLRSGMPGTETLTVTLHAETAQQKRQLRSRAIRFLRDRGLDGIESAHARVLTDDAGSELVNLLQAEISTTARVEVHARTRHLLPDEAQAAAQQAFGLQQAAITRSIELAE